MTAGARTFSIEDALLDPPALPPPPLRHALFVSLIALAALLHLSTLGWSDLYGHTEGQYAGGAREMLQSHQWIWPTNDRAIGETIATALGENCLNQVGQTTLDELIAQLRECRAILTNDTGTMHLAALLGVPVVAVFGSTEPALTGPFGNGHVIVRHHVECSPCFLRECPIDFRCMKEVTAQEVVNAIMSVLR